MKNIFNSKGILFGLFVVTSIFLFGCGTDDIENDNATIEETTQNIDINILKDEVLKENPELTKDDLKSEEGYIAKINEDKKTILLVEEKDISIEKAIDENKAIILTVKNMGVFKKLEKGQKIIAITHKNDALSKPAQNEALKLVIPN